MELKRKNKMKEKRKRKRKRRKKMMKRIGLFEMNPNGQEGRMLMARN